MDKLTSGPQMLRLNLIPPNIEFCEEPENWLNFPQSQSLELSSYTGDILTDWNTLNI